MKLGFTPSRPLSRSFSSREQGFLQNLVQRELVFSEHLGYCAIELIEDGMVVFGGER